MSGDSKLSSYSDAQLDAAALSALEMHSPGEKDNAPPELVRMMREAAMLLAQGVEPVAPRPSLKARLMSRVSDYEAMKPVADVRPYDGKWVFSGVPGVDIKTLFRDKQSGRTTVLMRMQPGARLPAHDHHDAEQCLVLRGDVRWRDLVYEEGDFVVMGEQSHHPEIHTVHGNLLLLVAGRTEFTHAPS